MLCRRNDLRMKGDYHSWIAHPTNNTSSPAPKRVMYQTHVELTNHQPSDDTDPFETLAQREERARLRATLATLLQDYQDVLILRYMHHLSYAEVAHILGKSELALRTLQHRALKALGRKLGMDIDNKPRSYLRGRQSDDELEYLPDEANPPVIILSAPPTATSTSTATPTFIPTPIFTPTPV